MVFFCPLRFFQFERMPQGITGAPATFQGLMKKAVGDMHLLQVIVYLDDIIVFGHTFEEHEERLLNVLDYLQECGLKVLIDKCQFCQSQVCYMGHIVSAAGVSPDPAKTEAVTCWKVPTESLRLFLGFCGFGKGLDRAPKLPVEEKRNNSSYLRSTGPRYCVPCTMTSVIWE